MSNPKLMAKLAPILRQYSAQSIPTPHPSLTYLPNFLSKSEQSILLSHSLRLLSSPTQTNSSARKKAREYKKLHPEYFGSNKLQSFMNEESYDFSLSHGDGVITAYREMLVRPGLWNNNNTVERLEELSEILNKLYKFIPILDNEGEIEVEAASTLPTPSPIDPPNHLSLHLLHLSGKGAIFPHVDNPHASGDLIVGVTLGSERVMRFKKIEVEIESEESGKKEVLKVEEGPEEFNVLLEPGSVYIQTGDLRFGYTHDLPMEFEWEGKMVGGKQRLSLMLRDKSKLSADPPKPI